MEILNRRIRQKINKGNRIQLNERSLSKLLKATDDDTELKSFRRNRLPTRFRWKTLRDHQSKLQSADRDAQTFLPSIEHEPLPIRQSQHNLQPKHLKLIIPK